MIRELTIEKIFTKPHYQNIMYLITDAHQRNKKITFEHLKYVLVKNTTDKLSDKKIKELQKFFSWGQIETWPTRNGKQKEIHSIIEFLFSFNFLEEQMNREQDLSNYLDRLLDFDLIEKKKGKKQKPYYRITKLGMFYQFRYQTEFTVELFLDYIFLKRMSSYERAWLLGIFDAGIESLIISILKKEKRKLLSPIDFLFNHFF